MWKTPTVPYLLFLYPSEPRSNGPATELMTSKLSCKISESGLVNDCCHSLYGIEIVALPKQIPLPSRSGGGGPGSVPRNNVGVE